MGEARQDRVTVSCNYCGKDVNRKRSEYDAHDLHFCDHACRGAHLSSEDYPMYDGAQVTVTCDGCGEPVTCPRSQIGTWAEGRTFCSRACYALVKSTDVAGEANFNWRGGYDPYHGPNWPEHRAKTLERDGYTCQGCTATDADADLLAHHVRPYRTSMVTIRRRMYSRILSRSVGALTLGGRAYLSVHSHSTGPFGSCAKAFTRSSPVSTVIQE